MNCVKCGNVLEENARFCTACGAEVEEEQTTLLEEVSVTKPVNEDTAAPVYSAETRQNTAQDSERLTLKDFYKRVASKKTKSWVNVMVFICFLSAAVSLVPLGAGNVLSLLDIAVYAASGVLILTKRNWIWALIPTLYSGVASVIGLVLTGSLSGIFAVIAGIMSTIGLYKINKAFEAYQCFGTLTETEI